MIWQLIVTAHRRRSGRLGEILVLGKRRSTAGARPTPPTESGGGAVDADPSDDAGDAGRPSRSARKRQAEALQKLGVGLTRMRPAKLRELQQHLQLPETLFEALLEVHRLGRGPALARQRQYIGRLMRSVDPLPIEQALAEFHRSGDAKMPR
jgi:ribosomal 50S subunit-associated protein YjgA (DUF615 family)